MIEHLSEIINAGVQAPSGDNCQPWRIEVENDTLKIFNLPEKDTSLYNWDGMASMIAHGALIENIKIASAHFGYSSDVTLFPDAHDQNFIAKITCTRGESEGGLYSEIFQRATNRKRYDGRELPRELIPVLNDGGAIVRHDRKVVEKLAQITALNEKIVLESEMLHQFLFGHIRWSLEEERRHGDGMLVETLELNPPQRGVFKLARSWTRTKILNALGLSKKVSSDNAKTYASSSAFCAVAIASDTPADFIRAGMRFEHLWLELSRRGVALHPLTGIIFLGRMLEKKSEPAQSLSATNREEILNAYAQLREIFNVSSGTIAMLCRIGYGDKPSAHSGRKKIIL